MIIQRRGKQNVWMVLLVPLALIAGMTMGFYLRGRSHKQDDRLEKIVSLLHEKYVDTIDNNKLYQDAVNGILQSLDPHTVYIPPDDLADINDDLEGGFSGIGVEFSIVRDTIEVTSVVQDGPASQAGMEIGDQLIKVNDSFVAGNKTTSDRIVRLLKGKQSSKVYVSVRRTSGNLDKLELVRDIIPIYSIDAAIMLDNATGYIKINRFSATTYTEFSRALKKLKKLGADQLIIDLRDNPGGYIDAATNIADDLLDKNKLIVYTSGIHSPKTEYKTSDKGMFEKGRLAILVNESSASASEILAGAVQDWDRGVIVGRRTFGKGLVQEQYDLPGGAALRVTVARYYTPSGRCIQRSFAKGRDTYEQDYENRFETGALTVEDTTAGDDTTAYYTSHHRVVYGGGGIKPDVYVPYDTSLLSGSLLNIIYSEELKTAILDYFIRNKETLRFNSASDFNASFNSQEPVISNYMAQLSRDERKDVAQELTKPVSHDYLKMYIKSQLARFLFRDNGYYAVSLKHDDVVNKALQVLNSDRYLNLIDGK